MIDEILRQIIYFTQLHRLCYKIFPSWKPSLHILCYHRVVDFQKNDLRHELRLHVRPKWFKRQLKYFRKVYDFVPPRELLAPEAPRPGQKPKLVLSFDDGTPDFCEQVFPLLKKYKIPSVLYISTAAVTEGEAFWWDRLYAVLSVLDWPARDRQAFGEKLKRQPREAREAEIKRLYDMTQYRDRAAAEVLTWQDIDNLRQGGVTVGAHGHRHQILTIGPKNFSAHELEKCTTAFRQHLQGFKPEFFAYPNGSRGDYDRAVQTNLKEYGMTTAVTTQTGGVFPETDPLALPRVMVYDEPIFRTAARLETAGVWMKISELFHAVKNIFSKSGKPVQPSTDAKTFSSDTVDEYQGFYDRDKEDCYSYSFRMRKDHILSMLTEYPGTLLDIGCGPGVLTAELKEKKWKSVNLDISYPMVQSAHALFPSSPPYFLTGDILQAPFKNTPFDFIVASGLLEYLPTLAPALGELSRLLKPNGRVILTIPASRPFYTRFLKIASRILGRPVGETPYAHRLISPAGLKAGCESMGWVVLEEAHYHFIFFPLDHLLPGVSLRLGKKLDAWWGRYPMLCRLGKGYIVKCIKPLK